MDIKDSNFDGKIVDLLTEISPSEEELPTINPWSKPIGLITWGLIFTTIRLEFLKLQYILPTIGVLLVFLGFRSLRSENKFFKLTWILSIIKLLVHLVDLVVLSTPLNYPQGQELNVGIFMLVVQITMFLLFNEALKKVYKKADKTMEENPLIWISVWSIITAILGFTSWSSSILVWVFMMVSYFFIARSLYQMGEKLDDAGYFMSNTPIGISNRVFGRSFIAISLIIVIGSGIMYSHLELDSKEYTAPVLTDERQTLLDLEFPAKALAVLSDEDIKLLSGAINVEASSEVLMFDPKGTQVEDNSEGYTQITDTYEPGRNNLEATTVYIELPENKMYIMHYFSWISGSPVWQDGITIPITSGVEHAQLVSSGLFYDKKDTRYMADFPRLSLDEFQATNMFGTHQAVGISGALSFPFGSKNQDGFVLHSYEVLAEDNKFLTATYINYVHNNGPTFIPFEKIEEQMFNGVYAFSDKLKQHYTVYYSLASEEGKE